MKECVDVAILVANYNNAKFIPDFFNSILQSTVIPKQIIIVDDGSKDNSVEVINQYSNKLNNLQVCILNENKGYANALNEGLPLVTSKYILRIDPDDILDPYRIQRQYDYLESHPDIDILGGNICYFDSETMKKAFTSNVPLTHDAIIYEFKHGACGMIHGSLCVRADLMKNFRYIQKNVPAEDYDIISRMILAGAKAQNLSDVNTLVRVHLNSVSNNLPFTTIQKTFNLCKTLWGITYSNVYIRAKHIHLQYYRKFLFNKSKFKKLIYISVASLMNPRKVVKRLLGK